MAVPVGPLGFDRFQQGHSPEEPFFAAAEFAHLDSEFAGRARETVNAARLRFDLLGKLGRHRLHFAAEGSDGNGDALEGGDHGIERV
jgi:hypothetical protein